MKTIRFTILFISIMFSALACTKTSQKSVADQGRNTMDDGRIIVNIENMADTRTELYNGIKTKWVNGDKIKVFSVNREVTPAVVASAVYTYDATAGNNTFIQECQDGQFDMDKFEAAYYPASAATSYDAQTKTISAVVPTTQTYVENSFGSGAAPMCSNQCASAADSHTITFKNAFALLKINLLGNNTVSTIKLSTASTTDDKAFAGTFNFTLSGDNQIAVSKSSDKDAVFEVSLLCNSAVLSTTDQKAFYIALPGQPASNKIDVLVTSGEGSLKSFTTVAGLTGNNLSQNKIVNMPVWNLSPGTTRGIFSVGDGQWVNFSSGNLYTDIQDGDTTFYFEARQFDYRTWPGSYSFINGTRTTDGTPSTTRGLFSWSNTKNRWGIICNSNNDKNNGNYLEWGDNPIVNGGNVPNYWRALTMDEVQYLLNTRKIKGNTGYGNTHIICYIQMSSGTEKIMGDMIYPDDFQPADIGITVSKGGTVSWAEWLELEKYGVVFLPSAGDAIPDGVKADHQNNNVGYYHTSSSSNVSTSSYRYSFEKDGSLEYTSTSRYVQRAVRLVHDLHAGGSNQNYQSGDNVIVE